MKEKYLTPYLYVEDLEKADILTSSTETTAATQATQSTTAIAEKERENAYKDISSFIFTDWF